jgi:hypothetical protein
MVYYGTIDTILQEWANFGVFRYVLPFLMIFAVVYGILSKTALLGDNKGVNATISLAVGLLALVNGYVSSFFQSIFPYTGMGIAVLLIALILMGLIAGDTDTKWTRYVWFGIGVIIFIVVVLSSFTDYAWWGGGTSFYAYDWPAILAAILILGLLGFIIFGANKKDK